MPTSRRVLTSAALSMFIFTGCTCSDPKPKPDGGTPATSFSLGGTVSGLAGSGLVLENNGGDDVALLGDGPFAFATKLAAGEAFAVTVKTQPTSPNQTCTVSGGDGTMGEADVDTVRVTCANDTFTVGGTVTGLSGTGLVLQNNGGDDLTVSQNGAFTFATQVASGAAFVVTVKTQPSAPTQRCTVSGGTGTITAGAVTSVTVNCSTDSFTVGGTVTGLTGTLVLQNNGGDDLTVNATGTFAFATPLASGSAYAVTVKTQPGSPKQTCAVASGSGTVGGANVTSVAVTCTTDTFTIGGTVTGLNGTLVLQNNGADDLTLTADGAFTFATKVDSGRAYVVTVKTQPGSPKQTCALTKGSGSVGAADVTDVAVVCSTDTFTVGGSVTGLTGTLVLQNSGADDLTVTADGAFTFATKVPSGLAYAVTVKTAPTGYDCQVSAGSGTVAAANVTSVTVACALRKFTVGGSATGVAGSLVLQNNGADDLTVTADGAFTFATSVAYGQPYAVTVKTAPTGYDCQVTAGSGTLGLANVTAVAVACTAKSFTVGGGLAGLTGTLVLQNNGADDLTLTADNTFTFATNVAYGQPYAVTVKTAPAGYDCQVTRGSGTMGAANVTDVSVTCAAKTYTVGGTVTGLTGTLVLQDNGADDLTLTADGAFTFATRVTFGQPYAVTVKTAPGALTCGVTAGSGTMGAADVTSVVVTCSSSAFTVGGTLGGFLGNVVLQNNGADDLTVTANGAFTFATKVVSGQSYAVTVKSAPAGVACQVTGGSGTMGTGDVSTVAVACSVASFTVGGTVSGLTGLLVLRNNGGDDLTLTADGTFTFATKVAYGQPYAVTVKLAPTGYDCQVTGGAGTMGAANVTSVAVACTALTYSVGGLVTGLSGTVVLQDNGADDLTVTANGPSPFTFATKVAFGQPYAVTVKTQPASPISQTCTVTQGSGTMGGGDVVTVVVTCTTNSFAIGGTVSGLLGTLVLQNNGGDDLALTASGAFAFTTKVLSNTGYAVTVKTQPGLPSQQCTVSAGSGTVGNADVTSVTVTCPDASAKIAAIRAANTGTLATPMAIEGALVTYRIPPVGIDPGGYVLQAGPTGPALLIGDPDAGVMVGDKVSVTVTATLAASGGVKFANGSTGLVVHSTGNDVLGLVQDVSDAGDLVSNAYGYESELVALGNNPSQARLTGAFGGPGTSGAGHQAAAMATDALTDGGIQLRVVDALVASQGLAPGCTVQLNRTPMWRYNAMAQPSAWAATDVTVKSCPALTVTPSPANGATGVSDGTPIVLTFNQPVIAASLTAQTSSGACSGSVQLSTDDFATCVGFASAAPTLSGNADVATLVPAPGLSFGSSYKLKVLGSVSAVAFSASLGADQVTSFSTMVEGCNSTGRGAVVISQVYSAGGSATSLYNADFVELHNRGSGTVDLTGWSVQYQSTGGTTWSTSVTLSGPKALVPPGGYVLIQTGQVTAGNGVALTPDFVGGAGVSLSASVGKVALVKAPLASSACVSADRMDLVSFGSPTAACNEGGTNATAGSATLAMHRLANGCTDTDNNLNDFINAAPVPRDSASPTAICGCSTPSVVMNESGQTSEADYCSLQFVAGNPPANFNVSLAAGATSPTVYGQLYEAGLTPGSVAGVVAEVGVGPLNVNPETQSGWQWFPTTQNVSCASCGNNVEFQGTFTLPGTATPGSTWGFAFRYSVTSGTSWTYCDDNGAGSNPTLSWEVTHLGRVAVP